MLRNLLKYDFKSVFKYWWIAALSCLLLSVGGGGCIALLNSEKEFSGIIITLTMLGFLLTIFSYMTFSLLTWILIFTRFYKNFFSDEGYLTFTLPVKRHQLLNAKLIMSTIAISATNFMIVIDVLIMLCVGLGNEIFTLSFFEKINHIIDVLAENIGWYLIPYILEFLALYILSLIFSCLFLFCCITFASIITKKAKILTAIGIYYVASCIYSFVLQIFYIFGIPSLSTLLSDLPMNHIYPIIAILLLLVILFAAIFCGMLYTLQYWMLDRKLNLN